METLRRVPLWLAMAMVALVPVVTANLTALGIDSVPLLYDSQALPRFVVAVMIMASAWALVWVTGWKDGRVDLKVTPAWGLLGALAVWTVISATLSPHWRLGVLGQSERMEGIATFVVYAAAYGLGLQVVRSGAELRRLAQAFVTAAGLLAAYGLLQFAGLDPASHAFEGYGFDLRRAFATTGNPNFLAGALVIALPLAISLAAAARRRLEMAVWGVASLAILGALFATFTRGAWLAVLVQIFVLAVMAHRSGIRLSGRRAVVASAAAILLLAALAGVSLLSAGETNVIQRIAGAGGGSADERVMTVEVALDAVAQRPLVGYGPDSFVAAFRQHRSDDIADNFGAAHVSGNAHSWPLQAGTTLGVPGALLLMAALLSGFWGARRAATPDARRRAAWVATGALVGCIGFGAYMLTNVAVLTSTIPFWLLLGAASAPWARQITVSTGVTRAAAGVCALTALAVIAASISLVGADRAYLASRLAFHGDRPGNAAELAEKAVSLNPLSIKYARGAAQAQARPAYQAITDSAAEQEVRDRYSLGVAAYERALAVDGEDYATLAQLAALHAVTGSYLGDEALLGSAQDTALRAAELDRHAANVERIASGDFSDAAVIQASNTLPLP